MEEQMQKDVETIFENFRGMYETCVHYSQTWPDDMETTAAFLKLLALKTNEMAEDFHAIMVDYVDTSNGNRNQGKLFDE